MKLNQNQLDEFHQQGFLFVEGLLSAALTTGVMDAVADLCKLERPEVIFEKDGVTVRSLMNVHGFCAAADRLIRHPDIVTTVETILQSQFYIYQCILNLKRAFSGDVWQWHQDLPTYLADDGMPGDRLVNVLIFLEEVNTFNGPLMMIPGSHLAEPMKTAVDDDTTSYPIRALDNASVARYAEQGGIVAPKGPPGSVIFASTNIVHGSAPNMSPWGRAMMSLTVNAVDNKHGESRRPKWVLMNDFSPVVAVAQH